MKRRVIAIVGRPNVGKSALFNRLMGRRTAIVHPESGVTRDRLIGEATWGEEKFELIDTGGIANVDEAKSGETIETEVRRQANVALEQAAAVIVVVDLQTGIMPLDEEVMHIVRTKGNAIFVAANKADASHKDADAVEFERFGYPVFPVSATHNRGLDRLMEAALKMLPPAGEGASADNPVKIAIVGRPNVGKSSYVNRVLLEDRVIVSAQPGTTRDSIDVPFTSGSGSNTRHYLLIDTAGIRRVGKIGTAVERYSVFSAERSIRHADVCVLVLDASQGLTTGDKKIASTIVESGKGCVIVANKWDLATTKKKEFIDELRYALPMLDYVPVVLASATTGFNIRTTLDAVDEVAAAIDTDIPTGQLNRVLMAAADKVQPPLVNGKRLNIYYAAQTSSRPLRVALFVNDPKRVRLEYATYLVGALRRAFDLRGVPVYMNFKLSKGKRS